jgi:hypothetical protein
LQYQETLKFDQLTNCIIHEQQNLTATNHCHCQFFGAMIIYVGNQKASGGTAGQFGLKPIALLFEHPSAKADGNEFFFSHCHWLKPKDYRFDKQGFSHLLPIGGLASR